MPTCVLTEISKRPAGSGLTFKACLFPFPNSNQTHFRRHYFRRIWSHEYINCKIQKCIWELGYLKIVRYIGLFSRKQSSQQASMSSEKIGTTCCVYYTKLCYYCLFMPRTQEIQKIQSLTNTVSKVNKNKAKFNAAIILLRMMNRHSNSQKKFFYKWYIYFLQ